MDPKLVFDVGLYNGDDSAYYLHLGYRVVGIEANPLLARQATRRFEREIRLGRMKVLNVGVLKEAGVHQFFRNLTDDGWSSFQPEKGRKGGEWVQEMVPCVTLRQLVEEHGQPFFVKIDIEGTDFEAIQSLTPATAPAYVSVELNCEDPILEKLIVLGYTAFKFVNGATFWATPPIFDHELGWRILRKVGRIAPVFRHVIRRLPAALRAKSEYDPPGRYSPDGYPFGRCSSGPFGEQAAGSWLDGPAAVRWFERLKGNYRRAGLETALWWDVHARHSSAPALR